MDIQLSKFKLYSSLSADEGFEFGFCYCCKDLLLAMRIQNHLAEKRTISIEIRIQNHLEEETDQVIETAAPANPRRKSHAT